MFRSLLWWIVQLASFVVLLSGLAPTAYAQLSNEVSRNNNNNNNNNIGNLTPPPLPRLSTPVPTRAQVAPSSNAVGGGGGGSSSHGGEHRGDSVGTSIATYIGVSIGAAVVCAVIGFFLYRILTSSRRESLLSAARPPPLTTQGAMSYPSDVDNKMPRQGWVLEEQEVGIIDGVVAKDAVVMFPLGYPAIDECPPVPPTEARRNRDRDQPSSGPHLLPGFIAN